jgi:hypothetical protein
MCNMARDYATRDQSPKALVEESGYQNVRSEITVEMLKRYLAEHRDLIVDWQVYCDDPRTDMWILREESQGRFLIAHRKVDRKYRFTDPVVACAIYVKLTFDSIASVRNQAPEEFIPVEAGLNAIAERPWWNIWS